MKTLKLWFALATFAFAVSAFALDLESARASKAISELPTGYIKANSPAAKSLADEVNAKRKKAYDDIAREHGLPVDQVASQAAKKIAEKQKGK